MKPGLRIGACQANEILGDIEAALACVEDFICQGEDQRLDLLLFPECFLQGYLVTDEHLRRHALDLQSDEFGSILQRLESTKLTLIVGIIERSSGCFYNSAVVIKRGSLSGVYRKTHLSPGESVFTPGQGYPVFELKGVRYGMNICYDTQFPAAAAALAEQGADVILVPAQNMMRRENAEKWRHRHNEIRAERARETGLWLISADVTGERGGTHIGYGPTCVLNPQGEVIAQVPCLSPGMTIAEIFPSRQSDLLQMENGELGCALAMIKPGSDWDIPSAVAAYNVDRWGSGYFGINAQGNVQVMPSQNPDNGIDIMQVIEEAKERGLAFPLTIRFQDLLRHRVQTINEAFSSAILEASYKSRYKGVFPIKVNQLREVVEEIIDAGAEFQFGLEAGSKPELLAAIAIHKDPESLIICNGYKDVSFIQNALLGRKLGKQVIMVVEKLEELRQIINVSKEMGVDPMVGIRVRLQAKGAGKWATSGGENAKFGLSTADLVEASEILKSEGMPNALRLIHFHVGSQVPDIGTIKRAVREAARFYAKVYKMGHELEFLDVGGGLGVDYDGSRTSFDSSTNYSLREYARDIVYNIMDVCDSESVPHPVIVSESGRALVAHHSVLVIEAFGSIEKASSRREVVAEAGDPKLVKDILEIHAGMARANRLEALHDAQQIREQAQQMFDLGLLDLEIKAKIEIVYWRIAETLVKLFHGMRYIPEEIRDLENSLSDQYLCNFSVFQSLLDHWALGQLFPIMPLHRLDTAPTRNGTLVDITCDSDGKISKFIDLQDVKETLPLHALNKDEPYYLGLFLMGAYQDIMGDLHNLFGRVNEVHVFLDDDEESGFYIEETIEGSTIGNVLSMTQWDLNELIRHVKTQVDQAIKSDRVKPSEGMRLLANYEKALQGYTYLNFPPKEVKK